MILILARLWIILVMGIFVGSIAAAVIFPSAAVYTHLVWVIGTLLISIITAVAMVVVYLSDDDVEEWDDASKDL